MPSESHSMWAVLIGIEYYDHPGKVATTPRRNENGEAIKFKSLNGCVNDVLKVEKHLINSLRMDPDNITKLLSPSPQHQGKLDKVKYKRATYKNIVNTLKEVSMGGQNKPVAGDFVYLHFSGHGSTATSIFEAKTEKNAIDEALVPCDVTLGGHYLRDLELGALLQDMVAQELVVTVVLDCCHSGGAIRGGFDDEAKTGLTRGIGDCYVSDRKSDTCQEMARIKHWIKSKPSWISDPQGFVVLTACLKNEVAKETANPPWHGLLTYHLLECLQTYPHHWTAQTLFEQIRSEIQNGNAFQTPDLIGSNERFFFGKDVRHRTYSLRIDHVIEMRAEYRRGQVILSGGAMHGVQENYGYAILPVGFDLSRPAKDTEILAKGEMTRWTDIKVGCPVILNKIPIAKKLKVQFVAPDMASLKRFENAWRDNCGNQIWLQLGEMTLTSQAFFSISINQSGNFSIHEPSNIFSSAMEHSLKPLSALDMEGSMPNLISRLEHLSRFKITKDIRNASMAADNIAASVSCKVSCLEKGEKRISWNDRFYPRATEVTSRGDVWEVPEGRAFQMTLRNNSDKTLSIVLFDWTAELSIVKLYPSGFTHVIIKPNEEKIIHPVLHVAADLRAAANEGMPLIDTYKLFVSEKVVVMTALMLESLKKQEESGKRRSASRSDAEWQDLDDLLGEIDVNRGSEVISDSEPRRSSWDVMDVKMRVIPNPAASVASQDQGESFEEEEPEPHRRYLG